MGKSGSGRLLAIQCPWLQRGLALLRLRLLLPGGDTGQRAAVKFPENLAVSGFRMPLATSCSPSRPQAGFSWRMGAGHNTPDSTRCGQSSQISRVLDVYQALADNRIANSCCVMRIHPYVFLRLRTVIYAHHLLSPARNDCEPMSLIHPTCSVDPYRWDIRSLKVLVF